jgi:hypothetical protein
VLHTRTLSHRRCWTTRLPMQTQTELVSAVRQSREPASACRWSQIRDSMFLRRLDARPEPTRSTICSPPSCKLISWLPLTCQIHLLSLTTTTPLPPRHIATTSPSSSPLHAKTRTTRVALPFPSTNWALPCTIVHWVLSRLRALSLAPRLTVCRLLFLCVFPSLSICALPLFSCALPIQNIPRPFDPIFRHCACAPPSQEKQLTKHAPNFLSYLTILKPLQNLTLLPSRCLPLSTARTRRPPPP